MGGLRRLWRGEVALVHVFWDLAIIGGLVINLSTTLFFVLLIEQGLPITAFIVGHAFSVPYNIVVGVGLWRAADRYDGPRRWPFLARVTALPLLFVLSFL
jgi:hypothetical protein